MIKNAANFGRKPTGRMTAEELVRLYAMSDRHENALNCELKRSHIDEIVRLAYGEYASSPVDNVPADLGSLAYDEMERRQTVAMNLRQALGLAQ